MAAVIDAGEIAATNGSRALGQDVLYPPGSALVWPLIRPVRLLTIGLLSPRVREIYGFTWTAADQRALARWVKAIRLMRRITPGMLREWPAARRADRGAQNRRPASTRSVSDVPGGL